MMVQLLEILPQGLLQRKNFTNEKWHSYWKHNRMTEHIKRNKSKSWLELDILKITTLRSNIDAPLFVRSAVFTTKTNIASCHLYLWWPLCYQDNGIVSLSMLHTRISRSRGTSSGLTGRDKVHSETWRQYI